MATFIFSTEVLEKLSNKHQVTDTEVKQCFDNRCGINLVDDRAEHRRNPPTLWFVAETNKGRLLKVVFQYINGNIKIITAYEANQDEIDIYESEGK